MTDGFKAEIRNRMGESPQEYVFRSNKADALAEEIRSGRIEGGLHRIIHGEMIVPPSSDPRGESVYDLEWANLRDVKVPVTGGVSSSLAQTRRFAGGGKFHMVLRAAEIPFEPIDYTYEWFNQHPGALAHVRSASTGELRATGPVPSKAGQTPEFGHLQGLFETRAMLSAEDKTLVGDWQSEQPMPGTTPNTKFKEEQEWLAFMEEAPISDAVEGVTSIMERLDVRIEYTRGRDMIPKDAPDATTLLGEVYEKKRAELGVNVPYYIVLVEDFQLYQNTSYEGWRLEDIISAHGPSGEMAPESLPGQFRGVPSP